MGDNIMQLQMKLTSGYRACLLALLILAMFSSGCTTFQGFPVAARGGDTITLPIGWHPSLSRSQLTVTVTPSSGAPVVYPPGDPNVKSLVNLYPDPLSRIIIEREAGDPLQEGWLYGLFVEQQVTNLDKDFSQKLLMMDLPQGIATGTATISFSSTGGETILPVAVDILPGVGVPHDFQIQEGLQNAFVGQLDLAERAPHYAVEFSGVTVPYAIEIKLSHDPDAANGGVGIPYVVSTRGSDLKSVIWNDTGTEMHVILMPASKALTEFVNFRFYVAGGLQNVQINPADVKAFDINGTDVLNVSATITPSS